MPNVVFVAPFFMEATLRFIQAVASTPGVRLGLVSQDPGERLPAHVRPLVAAHYRVEDGLSPSEIAEAVRALGRMLGPIERLIGTLEELQVPLGEVRETLGIPGMDAGTARNFRDKSLMKDVLRAHDLPCAKHALAHSPEEAWAFVQSGGFPVVAKPPAGAGAKSTFRLDGPEALRDVLAFSRPSPQHPLLLEEFVVGEEHSLDSVCVDGRMTWHSISRYFPSPLEVLRQPWVQWTVLLPRDISGPEYQPIREAGGRALQVLGLRTGLSHMEWFRRPDGSVALSEVAARPPGAQFMTLISYAHDVDFYRMWAQLMVHHELDPPARKYACGAAFLRGQGQGKVTAIHGLEQAQQEVKGLVVEVKLPQTGQSPSGSYEGEGYVILRHPDTAAVEQALRRVVTMIQVELG